MFRRCILESGSIRAGITSAFFGHGNPRSAVERSRIVIADLGCDDTPERLEKLRNIPAEELLYNWHFDNNGDQRGFSSNPVLDGLLFKGDCMPDPRAQTPNPVDLLFGFNTNEGTMFADPAAAPADYEEKLRIMFPEHWQEILAKYPVDAEHTPWQRLSDIYGLQKFQGAMLPYADVLAEMGNSVYAYHFDYMTDRLRKEGLGVRHIAELPFVFNRFLNVVGAALKGQQNVARHALRIVEFYKNRRSVARLGKVYAGRATRYVLLSRGYSFPRHRPCRRNALDRRSAEITNKYSK